MDASNTPPPQIFPVPVSKIANEFHLSIQEILDWLSECDVPVRNVAGQPGIEPLHFVEACRQVNFFDKNKSVQTADQDPAEIAFSKLEITLEDKDILAKSGWTVAELAKELNLGENAIRSRINKGVYHQLPGTPIKVCSKSIVFKLHGVPDPRISKGENDGEA